MGIPPTIFDGDRSKVFPFLTQFGLFCFLNDGNPVFLNPAQRVALALTYIRGPKVDDWVYQQFDTLLTRLAGDDNHAPTHANTDEVLWEDFMTEFGRAYNETAEEVLARLKGLRMTGDDVEAYIATFGNLMTQAEREREDKLMVDYFRQGLPTDWKQSIMKWETIPDTLDEWQSAARKEEKRRRLTNVCNPGPKGGDTDTVQTEEQDI